MSQTPTPFFYGSFNLNDTQNYFVVEKPYDLVSYQQTLFKISRQEGRKKVGEIVNERQIAVKIRVIAGTRIDLEQAIQTLYQALSLRQQQLVLYATDNRYYIADCIEVKTLLSGGQPISTTLQATFICQQPWAYDPSVSSFATGVISASTGTSGTASFPLQYVTGGGTVYSRPQINVMQQGTSVTWTSLTITQQTDSQQIVITTGLPTASGQYLDIYCDPTDAINGYTVQAQGSGTPLAFSGVFPVLEPASTPFSILIGGPNATTISINVTFTWTARWLT